MLFLPDPSFVGSAFIQESLPKGNAEGDDDKIYFFFSEAGKEFDFFDNTIVSRIARVCKVSDALGQTVHPKEWLFPLSFPFFFLPPPCSSVHRHPRPSPGNLTCHCALCVRLHSAYALPRRRACHHVCAVNVKNEARPFFLSDDPGSPVTEKHSSRVSPPPLFDSFPPPPRLPRSLSCFDKYLRSAGTGKKEAGISTRSIRRNAQSQGLLRQNAELAQHVSINVGGVLQTSGRQPQTGCPHQSSAPLCGSSRLGCGAMWKNGGCRFDVGVKYVDDV